MAEINMPRLSDTMSEGTVARWLKQPGDRVEKGDILLEIETDKATMEVESYENGTLQEIVVKEGQTVPIGAVIGRIGDGPAASPSAAPAPASEVSAAAPAPASPASPAPSMAAEGPRAGAPAPSDNGQSGGRLVASPVARRLAQEEGVDLRQVQGTGPGGRILKGNVAEYIQQGRQAPAQPTTPAAPAAAPAPAAAQPATPAAPASAGEVVPFSRMRRAIARAMNESKPGVPHIYVTVEIDMAAAMQLRKQLNDGGASEVKISVNDLVVKAAAKALTKFPALNSSYAFGADGQAGVIHHSQINVSVAVAIEDGLLAPVVRDTDKKSVGTVSAEIRELAKRARDGKSKQQDLEGATFQVSNLGMYDVVEFVSIITVPQAASLSVGAVREVPVVRDGQIVVGQIMHATLSVDHRVADGATAAQYLQELTRLLQSPLSLLV